MRFSVWEIIGLIGSFLAKHDLISWRSTARLHREVLPQPAKLILRLPRRGPPPSPIPLRIMTTDEADLLSLTSDWWWCRFCVQWDISFDFDQYELLNEDWNLGASRVDSMDQYCQVHHLDPHPLAILLSQAHAMPAPPRLHALRITPTNNACGGFVNFPGLIDLVEHLLLGAAEPVCRLVIDVQWQEYFDTIHLQRLVDVIWNKSDCRQAFLWIKATEADESEFADLSFLEHLPPRADRALRIDCSRKDLSDVQPPDGVRITVTGGPSPFIQSSATPHALNPNCGTCGFLSHAI